MDCSSSKANVLTLITSHQCLLKSLIGTLISVIFIVYCLCCCRFFVAVKYHVACHYNII